MSKQDERRGGFMSATSRGVVRRSALLLTLVCAAFAVTHAALAQPYPVEAGPHHRSLHAGRKQRRARARGRASTCRTALKQPFVVENKPGASGQIGAEAGAKSRARRLHAAGRAQRCDDGHAEPLPERSLRSGQRLRADRHARRGADRAGRQRVVAVQVGERAHRGGEGEAGRAVLCVVRRAAARSTCRPSCSR